MEIGSRPTLAQLKPAIIAEQGVPLPLPYAVLCLTTLPYRQQRLERPWVRRYESSTMTIEPGYFSIAPGEDSRRHRACGIPFGSRARIVLLYFLREVARTGQREVQRSDSFRRWLEDLGIPVGGKTYRAFREQELRIFNCRLNFTFKNDQSLASFNECIVEGGVTVQRADSKRSEYSSIILSRCFFESASENPLPVADAAIRQLAGEPFALDIYCWLASHLHKLESGVLFTWPQLHNHFGIAYAQLRHFKMRFDAALASALAVYPEACVLMDADKGVTLLPSKAPAATTAYPASIMANPAGGD